ncbi:helix-turn-helix transcriptional regulator [Stagnihabitans tardus]|uniref:Helix-turn-helix domain-containing protein n=1 Tax=Stagnihabitans tardus TaxID=2699202 RepID=A0AAE4YDZ4_9RHOB|nr:helix-turn-helix domain-containing protein [Stagnihabitans tardus]NBZ87900.1 helix-turn-helix domain-containing protein [Stagnihabitans tardus]
MNENGAKLEGVKRIADFLGVDESTVRRWIKNPKRGAPIRKLGGRYFAWEADLVNWLSGQGLLPA